MTALDDLIARLEKATGPDRELDGEIALRVLGWTRDDQGYFVPPDRPPFGGDEPPRVTERIDDALKLVPDERGISWSVGSYGATSLGHAIVGKPPVMGRLPISEADTPALALCLAALRHRQAMSKNP